jgi:GxxExxY protein
VNEVASFHTWPPWNDGAFNCFDADIRGSTAGFSRIAQTDTENLDAASPRGTHEAIIGAFFTVYNELGYGFIESVYKRALVVELQARGISCEREVMFTVYYKGVDVGDYRADLVVEGKVIVEVKTADKIAPVHEIQVVNYLRAADVPVGLLLNYGPHPVFRRLVLTSDHRGVVVSTE